MSEVGASRDDVFYRFAHALHELVPEEAARDRLEALAREMALAAYMRGQEQVSAMWEQAEAARDAVYDARLRDSWEHTNLAAPAGQP